MQLSELNRLAAELGLRDPVIRVVIDGVGDGYPSRVQANSAAGLDVIVPVQSEDPYTPRAAKLRDGG